MAPTTVASPTEVEPTVQPEPSIVSTIAPPPRVASPATLDGERFVETFDGAPASPTPWRPSNWDVTVHSRDVSTFEQLEPMAAEHGPDCAGPPATHESSTYESAVYQCRDHVMTAINAGGYAMIYLTPDRMVDFSEGEAVIQVDVSTLRSSDRDWWDVWITPYDDSLQLPLDLGSDVDATGPPRVGIQVTLATENQMKAVIWDDFEAVQFPDWPNDAVTGDTFTGYETFLTPDAARRDTFEIAISRNRLRVGMPQYDFWWVDTEIPELDWTQGVVQLGHHSYNPTKDCNVDNTPVPPVAECLPNTWHWDNLVIDPSVGFSIVQVTPTQADASSSVVELEQAALPDSHLRFTGIGNQLQVRFDGAAWEDAQVQATQRETKEEHFASYWHPIPTGTTRVEFRGEDWWGGPWLVRGVSAWSPAVVAN